MNRRLEPGDFVITGDIPLAARVVENSGTTIGVRGELFDDNNVYDRLASRNLMEQFRSAGVDTRGAHGMRERFLHQYFYALRRLLIVFIHSSTNAPRAESAEEVWDAL